MLRLTVLPVAAAMAAAFDTVMPGEAVFISAADAAATVLLTTD